MNGYLCTNFDAEDYLKKECPNLKTASIRPGGFILDGNKRRGTSFLPYGTADITAWLKMKLLKQLPYGLSFFAGDKLPDNVKLSTVIYFVEKGINGHLEDGKVVNHDELTSYEKGDYDK